MVSVADIYGRYMPLPVSNDIRTPIRMTYGVFKSMCVFECLSKRLILVHEEHKALFLNKPMALYLEEHDEISKVLFKIIDLDKVLAEYEIGVTGAYSYDATRLGVPVTEVSNPFHILELYETQ